MAARGAGQPARVVAAALVAALLAAHVVRVAAVADREARPALAAALWGSHPRVLTDRALLAIATAARHGQSVPAATRADVLRIAAKAPLSPDPFLIAGAVAQTEGRDEAAERLLLAARGRDPRSRGARYLLAERFLRSGRVTAALIEMQAIVSLQSRGAEAFAPALAAYARAPGAIPSLKAFFPKYPRVEASVLSILATDAGNADLILALANVRDPNPDWRGRLISALVADGQFARAQAIWARLSGVSPTRGLFNPGFADVAAPPPFNWAMPETGEGLAEPDGKGGLDVLYYGRATTTLARQLLSLPAGRYRLATTTSGEGEAGALRWSVRCAGTNKALADIPLRLGIIGARLIVPAGCAAQWLELKGIAGDTPRTIELKLRDLRLIEEAGR